MGNMPIDEGKVCPECATWKSSAEYGRNVATTDGLSSYCLPCNRRRNNGFYRAKRAAMGLEVRQRDQSPDGFKRCSGCREVKLLEEFHKNRKQPDGRVGYCKSCRRDIGRATHLKRMYGLDEATLSDLIGAQGGMCAICRQREAVHVDHDHTTNKVRGVLCFRCNVAIGQLQDDPDVMRNAIDYLERTRTPQCQRTLVSAGVYRLTTQPWAAAASRTSLPLPRPSSSPPV